MGHYKTYKIENIYHIIDVGKGLYPFWFRGHSKCFGNLNPRIFREGSSQVESFFFGTLKEREFRYIDEYQRKVPVFSNDIPEKGSIEWLFMMQHYGAPTRLLDWTENILVATYFAVCEHMKEDGEIWVIFPQKLNKHYAGEFFWLWDSPQVSYLAKEPFWNGTSDKLAEKLGLRKFSQTPLAFYPPLSNPRMVAQSSVFTIHPEPNDKKDNTIVSLSCLFLNNMEMVRYVIPSGCKSEICNDLNKLGINRTRLFPEQDSVAVDLLKYKWPRIGYPTNAPKCGGEIT